MATFSTQTHQRHVSEPGRLVLPRRHHILFLFPPFHRLPITTGLQGSALALCDMY